MWDSQRHTYSGAGIPTKTPGVAIPCGGAGRDPELAEQYDGCPWLWIPSVAGTQLFCCCWVPHPRERRTCSPLPILFTLCGRTGPHRPSAFLGSFFFFGRLGSPPESTGPPREKHAIHPPLVEGRIGRRAYPRRWGDTSPYFLSAFSLGCIGGE